MPITQSPATGTALLKWAGDILDITATRTDGPGGRMVFRTNLGGADLHHGEILANATADRPLIPGHDWHDLPMEHLGGGHYRVRVPLLEVGVFEGKACFIPNDTPVPEWPEGENLRIKVAPADTAAANTIYAAFVRQFGGSMTCAEAPKTHAEAEAALDAAGYTVIPPSGTFRSLIRHLDHICTELGFRNILLLPIHPTPTTYARMGRYGSPFAGRDFLQIDPALAEFDTSASPLDQFHELVAAVHARGAALMMDLPANHTGWASAIMSFRPEWYRRNPDGSFHSPGAWGVTWADLVELDYANPDLCRTVADVFLYWCRQGVDGFRCDAGYMIPKHAWDLIVSRVRIEYPDTTFLLEGLGGPMETTAALIGRTGLDWAYSEMFQTYDRSAFELMMPGMLALSESAGPLVHFAETHDNNRLAATSHLYAGLRTALSAMFSQQGAFGITAGVEWFAAEKIDVHGCGGLNWGASDNQCALIRRLNVILRTHPLFGPDTNLRLIQRGSGNVLAAVRTREGHDPLLILANLSTHSSETVAYDPGAFPAKRTWDLVSGTAVEADPAGVRLAPGQVCCLSAARADLSRVEAGMRQQGMPPVTGRMARHRRLMTLRTLRRLGEPFTNDTDADALTERFVADPEAFCRQPGTGLPRTVRLELPQDLRREVPVPPGCLLYIRAPFEFSVSVLRRRNSGTSALITQDNLTVYRRRSIVFGDASHGAVLPVHVPGELRNERLTLRIERYDRDRSRIVTGTIVALASGDTPDLVKRRFTGLDVKRLDTARLLLTNGTGAMAQIRLKWGSVRSQYDCLLALNRHPSVPDDRQVFLTRVRAWILCNGYSTPLSGPCLESVTAAPDGSAAEWRFAAPCGMGRRVPVTLRVALEPLTNRVVLRFRREAEGNWNAPADTVGLVLRPDIEWRNFHCKTKAYAGPEKTFPDAVTHLPDGFLFAPESGRTMRVSLRGGDWNPEGEWTYNIEHPEEAARGQEARSDLWSPGWFHIELAAGSDTLLVAGENLKTAPKVPALEGELPAAPMRIQDAMREALRNYIVRRDAHKTVIAGYPWFLDWGRDTLIFLRGVIAAGDRDTTLDILSEFGRFEKGGTIPNMIRGEDDANRETVDAPLWYGAAAADAIKAFGAEAVLGCPCGSRTVRDILPAIAEGYIAGTENGIRVDPKTALVWAPAHYTWMDTSYPAGTPRNGYAVEIQALWVCLLDLLVTADPKNAVTWKSLAAKARASFIRLFPLPDRRGLSDCLYADAGVGADAAERDDALRPNQLYAVTLGLLRGEKQLAADVIAACGALLQPGAIRTLADRPVARPLPIVRDGRLLNDPGRPYWGRYEGDEDTRRKPAYHNGTGWTFPFPLYAEALVTVYGPAAADQAVAYIASGADLINSDCVTQLPECTQGDAPHEPCGTGAQAWGVSEYYRVLRRIELMLNPPAPDTTPAGERKAIAQPPERKRIAAAK